MSTHDANLYEISRLLYDLRNPANREPFAPILRRISGAMQSTSAGCVF
jgi:hypothetical protein